MKAQWGEGGQAGLETWVEVHGAGRREYSIPCSENATCKGKRNENAL